MMRYNNKFEHLSGQTSRLINSPVFRLPTGDCRLKNAKYNEPNMTILNVQ